VLDAGRRSGMPETDQRASVDAPAIMGNHVPMWEKVWGRVYSSQR
jgi:hypothetical protein